MNASNPMFPGGFHQGREVPNPVTEQSTQLPVPLNVPLVTPPNQVPDNIGQALKYSPFNKLAEALGTSGTGGGELGAALQRQQHMKAVMAANSQYAAGQQEAFQRASKNADTFSDIQSKGWLPINQNPWAIYGFQAGLGTSLAAQYRRELNDAQNQNPMADPASYAGPIKQKYAGLIQGVTPEVISKFFIDPSQSADDDAFKVYQKNTAKDFTDQFTNNAISGYSSTLAAESQQIANGTGSISQLQANVKRQAESALQIAAATRIPFGPQISAIVEATIAQAKTAPTQTLKLATLDSLKGIVLPGGNKLLDIPDVRDKYSQAYHDLVMQDEQEQKIKHENNQLLINDNTSAKILEIAKDFSLKNPKTKDEYMRPDSTKPNDPTKISSAFDSFYSNNNTLPVQVQKQNMVDMSKDIADHMPTSDFIAKWGQQVVDNKADGQVYERYVIQSIDKNHQQQTDLQKTHPFPSNLIEAKIKSIIPLTDPGTGYWAGIDRNHVHSTITQQLQNKYLQLFQQQAAQWRDAHPNASLSEAESWANSQWYGSGGLWARAQQDIQDIKAHRGNYQDIINRGTGGAPPPEKPMGSPQAPAPISQSNYNSQYSFMTDPQAQKEADKQYYNPMPELRGPWYKYLFQTVAKQGQLQHLDAIYHQNTPQSIRQRLEDHGYASWQNPNPKQKFNQNQQLPPTGGKY